ncbi:PREDICTED: uncharacterized protein LOC109212521 [Nicotiana attenuata]|uniref:uncharacterized protein LOC109212521 n=1 Tax=Nicotiana attenuata TaxID=49451 RepID=UPI0009054A4D|nr:PREDICTED: uncharacterized protein LOC109212521 [Nicotiana attenuata]
MAPITELGQCRGELQAIVLMLRGLQSFSNVSGLTTNAAKSNIFSANMDEQCLQDLCELTGYKRGSLPFRYLGVPISPKKLAALGCEILVDKMTMKIKSWGTRNLSYAGRVIPGGLGVYDTAAWNEAVIAKYVWNIAAKTDNMWVRWVNHIYLKGRDWWQYKPPIDCSWYWRKIYTIRDKFADGYTQNHWLTTSGVYTLSGGYSWKKGAMEDWPWRGWVWNKMNMPKHSLICWLVAHSKLLMKDRLKHMGISKDSLCEICGAAEETVAHLFFECPLARRCMEDTMRWLT